MANLKATSVVLALVGVLALAELGRCHPIEMEEPVDQRTAQPRVEAEQQPTQTQPRVDAEQRPVRQAPCCGSVNEAPTEPNLNRPKRQNTPPSTPCCGVQQPTKRQADFPEAQKLLQMQAPQNCCGHLTERPVRQAVVNLEGSKMCCGQLEGEQPRDTRVKREQLAQTVALPDASTPNVPAPAAQPAAPAPGGIGVRTKRQVPPVPVPVPITLDTAASHPNEAPKPAPATPEIRSKRQEPIKPNEQEALQEKAEKRQTDTCCGVQPSPEHPVAAPAPQPPAGVIRQGRQTQPTPCCGSQAEPRADVAPVAPAAPAPTSLPTTA